MTPKKSTKPKNVALQQAEVQALQLRIAGASLREISVACGHPNGKGTWATNAIRRALHRERQPLTEEVAVLELARIDKLQMAWWPRAIGNPPDKDAAEIVLKCMGRRCGIYGIGAQPLIGELSIFGMGGNGNTRPGLAIDEQDDAIKRCSLEEKQAIAGHLAAIEGILATARERQRGLPGEVHPSP